MIGYREQLEKAILGPVMKELSTMKLVYQDGKIVRGPLTTLDTNSLWVWSSPERTRKCSTWNHVYFEKYGFVSRNCFSCWKVMCKLDFITDLLAVKDLQKKMYEEHPDHPVGKCGPEFRSYASYGGRYLGVWYSPITKTNTLAEAKALGSTVEKELRGIGVGNKVYVVRGCTEMEAQAGPSNLWVYPQERHEFEDRLDELFDISESDITCDEHTEFKIKKWMDQAFVTGDPKAKDLVAKFPEDFGVRTRINYAYEDHRIESRNVKRGRLYDTANRTSSRREEHEAILDLSEIC